MAIVDLDDYILENLSKLMRDVRMDQIEARAVNDPQFTQISKLSDNVNYSQESITATNRTINDQKGI